MLRKRKLKSLFHGNLFGTRIKYGMSAGNQTMNCLKDFLEVVIVSVHLVSGDGTGQGNVESSLKVKFVSDDCAWRRV